MMPSGSIVGLPGFGFVVTVCGSWRGVLGGFGGFDTVVTTGFGCSTIGFGCTDGSFANDTATLADASLLMVRISDL